MHITNLFLEELELQQKETEHGDFYHAEYDDKSWISDELSWMDFYYFTFIISALQ